jgi:hypothetical protein
MHAGGVMRINSTSASSFHGHRLGQVVRLIDVRALHAGDLVGQSCTGMA